MKLDKSLIYGAHGSIDRTLFLSNLTGAFLGLGCTVIDEGVETFSQRLFVENCGCTGIQGYHFARPMSEDACRDFLLEQRGWPTLQRTDVIKTGA